MKQPARIAFATHEAKPEISPDDHLAATRLGELGIEVDAVPWSREGVDWAGFGAVVIRSTWDYHQHLEAFRAWASHVETSGGLLFNPAAVVAWNSEKTYLRDLEAAGIAIVPTLWLPRGKRADLAALLAEQDWPAVVVKPTISASAYRTWKQQRDEAGDRQGDLDSLLADSGAMIQPLLEEVIEAGEWSFLYFRREGRLAFSHAVLKIPAAGDFRVQAELGGRTEGAAPPPELLGQVETLVATASKVAPGELLYARIDGVASTGRHAPAGSFLLMELELIEPFVFLEASPGSAERFAEAILTGSARVSPAPEV